MLPPRATTICHWPSATVCEWSSGRAVQTGRPSWGSWGRRLGGSGCPVQIGETPHSGSWGRWLGRVGVSCPNRETLMAVPGGGGWEHCGVRSKLARPPWRFLGKVAGRVGVSCLNWREPPHSGSWGRQLGRVGVSCPNRETPTAVPGGGSWGGLGCPV